MAEHGLQMLAQVHSHPGEIVDHSPGDDDGAFMPYENLLSIVVPDYGTAEWTLADCGVYRCENGQFIRMSQRQVAESVRVVPSSIDSQRGSP